MLQQKGKQQQGNAESAEKTNNLAPSISLPKGGGAIRGIGEKFAANPVTGTGSMSVPVATSPGRSGFGPQLSLSYDSGAGNGPFGLGWNLSLPSITRKTDKGLPEYWDAEESDAFILSGAEDLVPVLVEKDGEWEPEQVSPRTIDAKEYTITHYRPRIEGLFARIERWTNPNDPTDVFWRSISKDNITTWYGKTEESRIADPAGKTRIFSWLICQSYDDKGNAIVYEYKPENTERVNLSEVNEKNRTREANRYLKRIRYGNRIPNRDATTWQAIDPTQLSSDAWMFEVVFDYGEHYAEDEHGQPITVLINGDQREWNIRQDPFSSYRAGFEVRTYRLCQRVLMFHHFPDELGVDDYLVRSTEFKYKEGPIASFITQVIQSGYVRQDNATNPYLKKSLPPVEFEYSQAIIQEEIHTLDAESLENLPYGLDGSSYQGVDLDGEGISGILTEQAGTWFYKRNLSPIRFVNENRKQKQVAAFAPLEHVASRPSLATLRGGRQQLLDLAGDGQLDLVALSEATPGFFERTHDQQWESFKPFISLPNLNWNDPNLRFVDLNGDGHADVLITEDAILTWYPSLAEDGFGSAEKTYPSPDEEQGPRLVFADGTQSIYLADLSGDGLTDLARIRNGEVCYWPNLGYGRFGAKVTMDNAPWFDLPDLFDQKRIRLADIDGSGVTDIIYLGRDSIDIYLNQSGNSWADVHTLTHFPRVDNLASVAVVDLLGNGTACLVWSSPLPGDADQPMRYINLIGDHKPHLLVKTVNNLGAETHVQYAPSTKFYLEDKEAGTPWITQIPFPVHVVERVETYDRISRNRFVTRYAYHHGYFDGIEREFRGFGMVEQWDTEDYESDFATLANNLDPATDVPPVQTKTWFHTGAYLDRERISRQFEGQYYREPGLDDTQARALLLADTVLPEGLSLEEEREACRALKGSMLRQEVYALDGTDKAEHPYTVTEQNFTIEQLQPKTGNRHSVFFTHAREALSYHYERNPEDPRVQHALTLEADKYGNVLKSVTIGYGREQGLSPLQGPDKDKQEQTLLTYTENRVTNAIDLLVDDPDYDPDNYRAPLPCETCSYELTGYQPTGNTGRFRMSDFVQTDPDKPDTLAHIFDSEINYEDKPSTGRQRRLIEHLRTMYRPNDLGDSLNDSLALLPLETLESLALPGETYKLAFTPGLLAQVYQRQQEDQLPEDLLPNPALVLPIDVAAGQVADRGGYVDLDSNGCWWIPSGRVFHSPNDSDTAAQERNYAYRHFFLPRRFQDPFGQSATVTYDANDLLMTETRDALENIVRAENNYRVLQPECITDPNGNQSQAAFDVLGLVAGTAVKGKNGEGDSGEGDSLEDFKADLTQTDINTFFETPLDPRHTADLLGNATTRIIYDVDRYYHSNDPEKPPYAATLARETHVSDLNGEETKIQISFSYSDGFGREIQKKIQAEPEQPGAPLRWVGSGWTIFNNKGKPVRQYEPFFSTLSPNQRHQFEFARIEGVSPILFYDPVGRVIATLHPNHTYEKVVFDPWLQTSYDVNDTVLGDPRTDPDIAGFVREYFETQPETWQTWYMQRQDGALGAQEQAAAQKTAVHADTPTIAHFDVLGRPFLTIADNSVDEGGQAQLYETRVMLDIEGNQREVIDAKGRVVMRYDYYMAGPDENEEGAGNLIHQASMEAGERWMLNDVTGNPIRAWDSRNHEFSYTYDELRRPTSMHVSGGDGDAPLDNSYERIKYGDWKDMTPAERAQSEQENRIGKPFEHYDTAGKVLFERYDFNGNLTQSTCWVVPVYENGVNWSGGNHDDFLENEPFTTETKYDALNRVIEARTPDGSITVPTYNEANLLNAVDVNLR
ncbi:MAG: SpvB/TcaC N-terminal domain-containing protein, partial [Desulfobacteraceae bacterium]